MYRALTTNEKWVMSIIVTLFFIGLIGTALGWFGRADILGEDAQKAITGIYG
jgi:hypothetical protein